MQLLTGTVKGFSLSLLFVVALFLVGQLSASSRTSINRDYDPYFRTFSAMYLNGLLPGDDFRHFLAQCVQESGFRLDPNAQSWADARGVCQLLKTTGGDFGIAPEHLYLAKENIQGGARALRRCIKLFWPRETRMQALRLAQACYNSGGGNVIRAQVKCGGALQWEDIAPCMHMVTGRHAAETIHYVNIIPKWYGMLLEQDRQREYDYPVSDAP